MLRVGLLALVACHYSPPDPAIPIDTAIDSPAVVDTIDPDAPIDAPPGEPIKIKRFAVAQHPDATHDNISTLIKPQDAGHANLVIVSWHTPTATLSTLSDTSSNTYTLIGEVTGSTIVQQIYLAVPIAASTSNTFTAQFSANAAFCEIRVFEYAGVAVNNPVDQITSSVGISATPSVGPVTTTYANESLLGIFAGSVTGKGPGWVQRMSFNGDFVEEKQPQVIGTFTATATGAPAEFVAQLIALRGSL